MKKGKKKLKKNNKILICGIVLVVMFLIGGVIWFSRSTSLNSNQAKNYNTKFLSKNNKFKDLNITDGKILSDELVWISTENNDGKEIDYIINKDGNKQEVNYDEIYKFSEGLAPIVKNEKCGFIDKKGKIVIKPQFDKSLDFKEGLAAVQNEDGKWGYIDKTGKIVIDFQYNYANGFSEGLAAVEKGKKWVFIDKKGKIVIKINNKYFSCDEFKEGLAAAHIAGDAGFINKKGKFVIKPKFNWVNSFSEGLAAVKKGDKWGFIDKKGKFVIKPQFDDVSDFSEGLATVRKNKKYGFIDKKGKMVIKPQFDSASSFSEGLATVRKNEKCGFIDKKGKIVIKPQFDNMCSDFVHGLAIVWSNDYKVGFINKKGEFVIGSFENNQKEKDETITKETEKEETFLGFFTGSERDSYTGLYTDYFEFKEDKTFFRQINMTNGFSHMDGTYEITTYENQKAIKVIANGFENYPEFFLIKDNDTLEHVSQNYEKDNLWLMLSLSTWKRFDSSEVGYQEEFQLDGAIRPTDE